MGTETPPFLYEFEYPKLSPVKLNDPLMGTETALRRSANSSDSASR